MSRWGSWGRGPLKALSLRAIPFWGLCFGLVCALWMLMAGSVPVLTGQAANITCDLPGKEERASRASGVSRRGLVSIKGDFNLIGKKKPRYRLIVYILTWKTDFLEKEMATHSSVLAWRIPGMGEPGGLPSLGSHRVGHDWSDLAAAMTMLIQLKTSQGGTLSTHFWCLCQKLSLSPLYFNKTLLHTHTHKMKNWFWIKSNNTCWILCTFPHATYFCLISEWMVSPKVCLFLCPLFAYSEIERIKTHIHVWDITGPSSLSTAYTVFRVVGERKRDQ